MRATARDRSEATATAVVVPVSHEREMGMSFLARYSEFETPYVFKLQLSAPNRSSKGTLVSSLVEHLICHLQCRLTFCDPAESRSQSAPIF